MKYAIKEYFYKIPEKDLINDLRKTARKLKKDWITIREYDKHGKYNPTTIIMRIGGWNTALLKANLKIRYNRCYRREDLMRNLKNVWDKLGRQPKLMEMQKPLSEFTHSIYTARYGSWLKALKSFQKWVYKGNNKDLHFPFLARTVKGKSVKRRRIQDGMRYKILKRDKFKCVLCGRSPVTDPKIILHIDHKKPLSKGGKETMKNLRTLCSKCNLGKMTGD